MRPFQGASGTREQMSVPFPFGATRACPTLAAHAHERSHRAAEGLLDALAGAFVRGRGRRQRLDRPDLPVPIPATAATAATV